MSCYVPLTCLSTLAISLSFIQATAAHPIEPEDEMLVFGRGINLLGQARSGSEGLVGYSDFDYRPFSRVGELVEVIPGLVATQHSGSGKSNQYYLRGFNLDHGTDFAAFIDGAPINFRTHGHGQGYLDLNFLIPELIETVSFRKGPYFSDVGDFTAAATAAFKTYDELPESVASATIGEAGFRRGLVAASFDGLGGVFTAAAETVFTDSPYVLDEELEKYNGLLKYAGKAGERRWSVSLSAYDSSWTSTDQVPLRAIVSGQIDRLGFIDPDLGGETTRLALNAQYSTSKTQLSAYAMYYELSLFSNFTYFAADPVNGDEFEQRDERVVFGGSGHRDFDISLFGDDASVRIGGDIRYDDIFDLGLFQTAGRQRLITIRNDNVREFSLGGFAELNVALTDQLRLSVGVRGDVYRYDVDANLDENSGDGNDGIITPTANLAWRATDQLEFYASYGQGFHSNDVRGAATTIDPVTRIQTDQVPVLVRAEGAELGLRFADDQFNVTLAGFWLELDSELVFVGDAGTTEPNDGSRRFGVEFSGFWRPTDWITFDISAAYTDARFKGMPSGEDRIPQAVETVIGGGVLVGPIRDVTLSARLRHFGEAPLIEDGSVTSDPTTVVNLGAYYDLGPLRFGLDILNVFDSKDADITYFFESQLPGETAPVEDIHLHPIEPRQVRGSIRIHF